MKNKAGIICMLLGVLLMVGAVLLAIVFLPDLLTKKDKKEDQEETK